MEINITQTVSTVFGNFTEEALGSGILIDNQGHILTNNHVVDGTTTVQVTITNGNTVNGKVLGTDPVDD